MIMSFVRRFLIYCFLLYFFVGNKENPLGAWRLQANLLKSIKFVLFMPVTRRMLAILFAEEQV